MARKTMCFTISRTRALEIIRTYDVYACVAARVRDKLAAEVAAAEVEGRPISKARFAAVIKWFGAGIPAADKIAETSGAHH